MSMYRIKEPQRLDILASYFSGSLTHYWFRNDTQFLKPALRKQLCVLQVFPRITGCKLTPWELNDTMTCKFQIGEE